MATESAFARQPDRNTGPPRLLVVILNYRTPLMTINCLRSLAAEQPSVAGLRVVVVDNGSGDDSVARISAAIAREGWQSWITLKPLDYNGGFSHGNNRGINLYPNAQYILLLNSDTLVHAGCLSHCLSIMEQQPDIGALSCKLLNQDGSIQNATRRFPNPPRQIACALGLPWKMPAMFGWADLEDMNWDRETCRRDVHWLGGAFMMIRGEAAKRVGLLDESFFFYGEDVEFCYRLHRAGYRCHYDPRASITHLGGGSSDPRNVSPLRMQARYLLQRKLYGPSAERAARAVDAMTPHIRWIYRKLSGRETQGPTA